MSFAPAPLLGSRLDRVRAGLRQTGLDALLVTHPPNIFYLSNFQGSAGVLVVTRGEVTLLTDFRYLEAVAEIASLDAAPADLRVERVQGTYEDAIVSCLGGDGRRIGVEARSISLARYHRLSASLQLMPTDGLVEDLRLCKDAHERAVLREAGRRLSAVAREILPTVVPGVRELDVAGRIDSALRGAGFAGPAFPTIVAAGANGARPHARPGARMLAAGDVVVLDFGGVYDGYCVDLTRTVAMGDPGPDARSVHDDVRWAQDAAIAAIRPGVPAWEVDAAARSRLDAAGLGEAFGHGTGHGLGIEVHEAPRLTRRRDDASPVEHLAAGMVVTVEPGAYLPGRFGVRIEDDVLVTDEGCEVLTQVPRDLRVRL